MTTTCSYPPCSSPVPAPSRGRPPRYCSPAHRRAAYRARQRDATAATRATAAQARQLRRAVYLADRAIDSANAARLALQRGLPPTSPGRAACSRQLVDVAETLARVAVRLSITAAQVDAGTIPPADQ